MKKNDISPLMDVVVLKAGQQMLTGSDPKINNGNSEKPSYYSKLNLLFVFEDVLYEF